MYTPADSTWVCENRNREVYQASESRWSTEGVVMASQSRASLISRFLSGIRELTKREDIPDSKVIAKRMTP